MRIDELNGLPARDAAALLRSCADIDAWVAHLVAARPYPDADALVAAADAAAARWSRAEVEEALAQHPRIGERPAGADAAAAHSRAEQAGVDPADTALAARLAEGNRRYEERFGRIYLVRARGRTGAELLGLLEERLANDPATELAVTTQQLREIAVLRVAELVG